MILNIFFIGIGGALGAILRYGVNEIFEKQLLLSSIFGTLFINIAGCFLIGLIAGLTLPDKNTTFYFFIIGFLGSFTTMSAFSHQVNLMINSNFSVKNLIEKLKTPINKVAIELNEVIVDKKKLNKIILKNKDKIEIVHFIGGG